MRSRILFYSLATSAALIAASHAFSEQASTALARLAKMTAAQLAEQSPQAPVAVHVVAPTSVLAEGFSSLLGSELAQRKLSAIALDSANREPAEDVARRSGARSLARLRLDLDQGHLKVEGDLLSTWVNFWSGRARTRAPLPAAVVYASTEADAQALALFASSRSTGAGAEQSAFALVGATVARLPLPPAALATGDLNADGTDEVLVLTDEEIIALNLNGQVLARREHRGFPPSPTPCREPFGTIVVSGQPPRVAYFSAQRDRGEVLEIDLAQGSFRPVGTVDDVPLGQLGDQRLDGQFTPGQNTVVWRGLAQEKPEAPLSTLSLFPTPSGFHLLTVFPNGGASWTQVRRGARSSARLERLGTGSALVDLDGDGAPELVTTSPRYLPSPDELRVLSDLPVRSLEPSPRLDSKVGSPTVRWQGPILRGRVMQVAAARLNARGSGRDEQGAVLGIWMPDGTGEIQLFRRGSL